MTPIRCRSVLPASIAMVVALALAAGAPSAGAPQEAATNTVHVIVLDDADAPVTGLTAADIVIIEDDQPRVVTDVKPAPDPLTLAILVDTAKPRLGDQYPTRDVRAGLASFLKIVQAANPASKIAVMNTAGAAVMVQDFTDNTQNLTRAFGRLIPSQRTSAVVIEALLDIGKAIARQPGARRAVVSIDFDSQDTSGAQGEDVAAAIQGAGTSVWAISIRGQGGTAMREAMLDAITEISGGLRLTAVTASALEQKLTVVARALTSQYLVTYQRPGGGSVKQVRAAAGKGSKFLATRIISK